MSLDLTPDEWARIKTLWPAYEQAAPDQRRQLLADLSPAGRATVEAMSTLEDDADDIFARPAMAMLGMAPLADRREAPMPTLVGRRLGPYRLLREAGRGGMGAVYEAERVDDAYRQRVAIKTLWRGADSDVLLQRFRSERQILAALQHPNIAQLLDGGTTEEGTPWLAMEYVEGTPLDTWCDARQLDLPARLDLFRQVCAAVQHAHQRLVVHRDLKPTNILVNADGTVKLLDFGVAKLLASDAREGTLTGAGLSPFTAAYAAPEQLENAPVSTATDVYALGGVLTLLLAGAPPRDVPATLTPDAVLAIRQGTARAPSQVALYVGDRAARARGYSSAAKLAAALRGELDAIAGMALRAEPSRRYASVDALADDVLRYLRRDRVLARPDSTAYRVWSVIRRRRAISTVVGGAALALMAAAGITWRQAKAAQAEARRAERATAFLSGLVTGSNATTYDPLVRLAPNGTVSQLLDSALVRIPREFADDARIRAKLYTAIGANLLNQQRLVSAMTVLDSAKRLAADGYGLQSPEYAKAILEYATPQLELHGPRAVAVALEETQRIADRHPDDQELHARITMLRAGQAMQMGAFRRGDSLAKVVLATEEGRPRTMLSVRAQMARAYASSWITLDPRDYLQKSRAVMRLIDSLGLRDAKEVVTALYAEFESLTALNRAAEAQESLAHLRSYQLAREDTSTSVRANVVAQRAYIAGATGDTASRREALTELRGILDREPTIGVGEWIRFGGPIVDDAIQHADTTRALQQAQRMVARLKDVGSPMLMGFALWYRGQAELAAHRYGEALATVEEGKRWVEPAPDLASLLPLLRRVQYQTYKGMGRIDLADRLKKSVKNPGPFPPCTPGGNWAGCPDLPP